MLDFHSACQKHRQRFADLVVRAGCGDPEEMERVRRRLFVWLSEKYPRLVLQQFNDKACIGCALEEARVDTKPIRDAVQAIVRGSPLP